MVGSTLFKRQGPNMSRIIQRQYANLQLAVLPVSQSRSLSNHPVLRMQSSPSSSSTTSSPSSPQEPRNEALEYLERKRLAKEANAGKPRSRHSLFYTDIVPPLIWVFAYGSGVYFALHLVWNLLDRDEQQQLMDKQRAALEEEIQRASLIAQRGTDSDKETVTAKHRSSWLGWLWPFSKTDSSDK